MRLTKKQLKQIIREAMHNDGQSSMIGPVNMTYVHQQIESNMEHELLFGIQGKIQQAYNDPSGDGVDLGALAEDMGFADLMEQVAVWFEEYIAECESRYLR